MKKSGEEETGRWPLSDKLGVGPRIKTPRFVPGLEAMLVSGHYRLKDFDVIKPILVEQVRRSERLTADDLETRINW